MDSIVRFSLKDGMEKSARNFENFKVLIEKVDGSVVKVPDDLSYVEVSIAEGNYNIIKYIPGESRITSDNFITVNMVGKMITKISARQLCLVKMQ